MHSKYIFQMAKINKIFYLHKILFFLISVPIVIFVRIVSPIFLIRFGPFRSDVIGHMVFYLEYYLSKRDFDSIDSFDCFYFPENLTPNKHWELITKRHIRVNSIFYYFDRVNKLIPGGEKHSIYPEFDDRNGILANSKTHVEFNKDENLRGNEFLEKIGMLNHKKFVCLIVRDSQYKEEFQNLDNRNWSYHNFRDSDIDNYKESAMYLAQKGYWVFRMGKGAKKRFDIDHPKIFDYAFSDYRSDFLDVWLMANCNFCISTGTGIDAVATIFRRPILMINYIPISNIVSFLPIITIPKKLVWKKNKKDLNLTEHLEHNYNSTNPYENNGIEIYDRSSDEICDAVIEMEGFVNGSEVDANDYDYYQSLFWTKLNENREARNLLEWKHPEARIGISFIKNNINWFK